MSTDTPTGHGSGRTREMCMTICRIPALLFFHKVKAGQTGPPETIARKIMPQYSPVSQQIAKARKQATQPSLKPKEISQCDS
jgi:hypothetical protein